MHVGSTASLKSARTCAQIQRIAPGILPRATLEMTPDFRGTILMRCRISIACFSVWTSRRAHTSRRGVRTLQRSGLAPRGPRIATWSVSFALLYISLAIAAESPNVIAIVTDDQGRWAMGAYGNPEIHTPNMDRIAAEGALFTNAITATPVCSPSRASYLTGLYSTEVGINDWISPDESDNGAGLSAPTWPEAVQSAGYTTALVGKWHLGTQSQFHPTRRGFDHFMGFLEGGSMPMDPVLEVNGETRKLDGPLPDILVEDAIRWMKAVTDQPFALLLHFRAPHLPYGPVPEEDSAHYDALDPQVPDFPGADTEQLKSRIKAYYASISSVDRNIGRLLDALESTGKSKNTIVIFTSDHGYNEGRHGIDTKGNGQWMAGGVTGPKVPNMWDTSIAVPLAIRWPGVIHPGARIDYPVTQIDMFRTICGMVGVDVPTNASPHGMDFSPLLRGDSLPPRDARFGQYDLHNGGLAYLRMVRTDRFKFVKHFHERMQDELYDLQADPSESNNLLGRRPDSTYQKTVLELESTLTRWMQTIDDPLLTDEY